MGSFGPIIISYCDPEEQFIIWKLVSNKTIPGVTAERALLYCAANGWGDGIRYLIRTGVNREYLRVAQSTANLCGRDKEFKAASDDTKTVVVERKCRHQSCRKWCHVWKKHNHMLCHHPLEPEIPSCADNAEVLLLGSAFTGWEAGIDLARDAKGESGSIAVFPLTALENAFFHAAAKGHANVMRKVFGPMCGVGNGWTLECYDAALLAAANGGHKDAMVVAIEFGAGNIEEALKSCALKNSAAGVVATVELGARGVNEALISAAKWNNRAAAAAAIAMGAVNYKRGAAAALSGGHVELSDFILSHDHGPF